MKALLNVGLWIVSLICFAWAIYYWVWVAKADAAGPQPSHFAVVSVLIVIGVVCIAAWFMMRRKDDDQEISITR
ncbi:MAG TPA: hypothetical protein VFC63_23795 [Blastocatellia bacterium]|nr:hypothetical protein [Blastocatellia bacterium]